MALVARMKTAALAALGDPLTSIRQAAAAAGTSLRTLWRWREDDPTWGQQFDQARKAQQQVQVALVEESLAARSIRGNASAAETIFFLVNRAPHRWRHVNRVEVTGADGGPVVQVQAMSDEQKAERVAQLLALAEERKAQGLAPFTPQQPGGNGARSRVLDAMKN